MSKHFFPAGQGDELITNIFQSNTIPKICYCHLMQLLYTSFLLAGDKSIITNVM